ncbi:MAG: ABC transporter permease [Solirubrobacterales bacterium]|nr:ABC transporter permease [Solirubrobacterales bacterium]
MTVALARRLGLRLLGAALLTVAATAVAWLLLRLLRADLFPPGESVPAGLAEVLERIYLHGDFGRVGARELGDVVRERLPADLAILGGAMAVGLALGVAGGAWCATHPRSVLARALDTVAMVSISTPVYVVGLGALLLFGAGIASVAGFIPVQYVEFGEDPLRWLGSCIVPWLVLGLPLAGLLLRMMRGSLLDVLHEDYLRLARAKGLREHAVVRRHALPVALAPTLNLAGAAVPLLLLNLALVERVFSVPGIFADVRNVVGTADVPYVLALTTIAAALTTLASVAVDLALAWLDPRTR